MVMPKEELGKDFNAISFDEAIIKVTEYVSTLKKSNNNRSNNAPK